MSEREESPPDIDVLRLEVEQIMRGWDKDEKKSEADLLKLARDNRLVDPNIDTEDVDLGNEPRTKRPKLYDDNNVEPSSEGALPLPPNESLPKTLKGLALYIVQHCGDNDKIRTLLICGKDFFLEWSDSDIGSKEKFCERIEGYNEEAFRLINFGGMSFKEGFNPEEDLRKVNSIFCPTSKLLEEIERACGVPTMEQGDGIPEWEENFVVAENPSQLDNVAFPLDMSKGFALVVTGESGSGKSWFAKYFVPNKLGNHDTAYIYYTLADDDVADLPDDSDPRLSRVCKAGMQFLRFKGQSANVVYKLVSDFSRGNNERRYHESTQRFKSVISKALKGSYLASEWWKATASETTVEKLVVVVDEVGKAPDLARGLVHEVRTIYSDIARRRLAKKVLLVLVGSGLEHHIRGETLDFAVKNEEDRELKSSSAAFGTDPMKSSVIVLKGPVLEEGGTICGVATKDIAEGTYSRVLATNTRMLTRGVIPIFTSHILTESVAEVSIRRRALGSTNIVMDYAARVYIALNGLQRLDASRRESVLLTQFRLLAWAKLIHSNDEDSEKQSNPVFRKIVKDLQPTPKEFENTLSRGLITVDINNTSNALRYLACGGRTAPLDAQDGIAFEIILQHHLVRLSRARHNRQLRGVEENKKAMEAENYFCGQYDLRQAWPPSSSKDDAKLESQHDVEDELTAMYNGCKGDDDDDADADLTKISELVIGKAKFDLVMRQTLSNVQGADVLVLSKADGVVSLDMYQAKHYKTIQGPSSRSIKNAFSSLGVVIVGDEFQIEPCTGSAGFSYHGTKRFAKLLEKKLGERVQIGNRVLVFSKDWQTLSSQSGWEKFKFGKAYEKGLMLWTREMMEPTISALEYVPSSSQDDVSS